MLTVNAKEKNKVIEIISVGRSIILEADQLKAPLPSLCHTTQKAVENKV